VSKKSNTLFLVVLISACSAQTTSEDNVASEIVDVSTTLQIDEVKTSHDGNNLHNHDDHDSHNHNKENTAHSNEPNEIIKSNDSESDVNNENLQEENEETSYDANVLLPNSTPDKLEVLNFKLNEKININFSSELEREIHVHGYDIHFMVYPDKKNVLQLELTIAGEFEIEDHDGGFEFARLVVSP
tara:strand:- start:271 stop:828 length:558 start_codon:yes stop_codon:yes gene_type:complete